MKFYQDGNLLKIVRITGPTHNLLCAEMALGRETTDTIELLPIPSGEGALLDAAAVLREVHEGIRDANKRLNVHVAAKRLQFLPSDSPPVEVYRSLAAALVDYFVKRR